MFRPEPLHDNKARARGAGLQILPWRESSCAASERRHKLS